MTIHERISALRMQMEEKGLDAYIIPSEDPHGSEYVSPHWQSRKWISGFTGSAGTVVITKEYAGLWTDFRYYIQAAEELKDSDMDLFKFGTDGVPPYDQWLVKNLNAGQVVGINGKNFSASTAEELKTLLDKSKIMLNTDCSHIDRIWTEGRPSLPSGKVFLHDSKYNGKSRDEKLKKIRFQMNEHGATHHILTTLEDICWLFNIRGTDIDSIPVVISYAIIFLNKAYLFADLSKINDEVQKELKKSSIGILPYDDIEKQLAAIDKKAIILADKTKTNIRLINAINKDIEIKYEKNPTLLLKAIKNETEINNIRKVMESDGVAMVKFFKWVEENRTSQVHSELSLAAKLRSFRAMGEDFSGESFTPIPGYRAHGALCHYSAEEKSQYSIDEKGGLFLIDSGGQYPGGTTDITRTITMGNPTEQEIHDYTLVLKGHIALSLARFPAGTRGYQLDLLARMAMWKEGIDYGHGTGHGVGYYLSVHEGPQNISSRAVDVPLLPGMVISNEPGIYREGSHGIRIENLVLVKKEKETEFGSFNKFETLTLCPYEPALIDVKLLDNDEKVWINEYNHEVQTRLSTYLNEDEKTWLKRKTIAL
ncbi:MAG: aminopeptidase P family protein [Spirochaetaceae bacterium]|jgi:Xaa-Pro aminopeptidase|nr:aminopeptidase P family protein [Spirochaetaceae bacterium]